MTDEERAARVALALAPGIGRARYAPLLDACGSAAGALRAPVAFLRTIDGMTPAAAAAIAGASLEAGRRAVAAAERLGGVALVQGDAAYPAALATIPDPPLALFALGRLELLSREAVAVVGSRRHSAYGAAACRLVVDEAVCAGLVVVSGLARGVDATAHAHTLELGGDTIGVLGNGLGIVYPTANRALYQRMARDGLLLTELPPGERPRVHTFPRRNRLVSGLARVTVVVEAAAGSGALITAGAALEQGRDVMALPGPITAETSVGTNRLIRDGATPYAEWGDLARLYPGREAVLPPAAPGTPRREGAAPPREWERLLTALGTGEAGAEDLAGLAELDPAAALAALLAMEVHGEVVRLAGGRFRRAH